MVAKYSLKYWLNSLPAFIILQVTEIPLKKRFTLKNPLYILYILAPYSVKFEIKSEGAYRT